MDDKSQLYEVFASLGENNILHFFEFANEIAKQRGKMYEFDCPVCGGHARAFRAECNGHLHAECEKCGMKVME